MIFVPLAVVLFVVWATVKAWRLADGWLQERRRRQVQHRPVLR
jgi:hypothetical protein